MKHDKKQEILIDAVSWIDEDIVDQGLKKRFLLWKRKKFPKKLILSAVSVAACLSIVLTGTLAYLHHRDKIGDNTPIIDKNIPVYLGMTVENTPPVIQSAQKNGDLPFKTLRRHNQSTPFGALALHRPAYSDLAPDVSVRLLSNTTEGIDALTENESMDIFGESYYAMPNEDIYIHIHINNPAEYEIRAGLRYGKSDLEIQHR